MRRSKNEVASPPGKGAKPPQQQPAGLHQPTVDPQGRDRWAASAAQAAWAARSSDREQRLRCQLGRTRANASCGHFANGLKWQKVHLRSEKQASRSKVMSLPDSHWYYLSFVKLVGPAECMAAVANRSTAVSKPWWLLSAHQPTSHLWGTSGWWSHL